jgi:hypothetical protein
MTAEAAESPGPISRPTRPDRPDDPRAGHPDRPRVLELVRDIKALKEKPPALQAADYLAWMTNRHLRDRDVRYGVFRILAAPMFGFDYTYDRLVQDYKDWNGYFRSGKRRIARVH